MTALPLSQIDVKKLGRQSDIGSLNGHDKRVSHHGMMSVRNR
jgi:hypothetical protein